MKLGFRKEFKFRFLNFTGNMNISSIFVSTFKVDVKATPRRFNMLLRHQTLGKLLQNF
jgi:hypothetical protein